MRKFLGSFPDIIWKRMHVDFEEVLYEKGLDLRRNFKFSVSWFISFAIRKHLDEIVKKLTGLENQKLMDNCDRNFVYIAKMYGNIQGFISFLGLPEEKYLKQLL